MTADISPPPGLARDWQFTPSPPGARTLLSRAWRSTAHRKQGPEWQCIRAMTPAPRWIGYFMFLPDGVVTGHHRFTLDRLRDHDARLAIICAAPAPQMVPAELLDHADALYWKGLPGFDFSAYALLIAETARYAAGSDLIVMNDSVLGPFENLHTVFDRAPWRMAGLTAYSLVENHIQSYAFALRAVDEATARQMDAVAGETRAFDRFQDVIYCQETRFARIMARHREAGALWFSDHRAGGGDLPLVWPLGLIEEGFPFLKRSLFTKFSDLADRDALDRFLEQAGHPPQ